jgi:protein-S-isoprenylcysteine O-methyltransferase Ste14
VTTETAAFAAAAVAMPACTSVIGLVYHRQYAVTERRIAVAVAAHLLAVSVLICSYGLLCVAFARDTLWQYPGWAVFALGTVLFWYAVRSHPACLLPDDEIGVVRVGPYRHVRHPIYAGGLVAALGLVGVAPAWQTLAVWVELAMSLTVLAIWEEQELVQRFGAAYRDYARRTRLLIPGIL